MDQYPYTSYPGGGIPPAAPYPPQQPQIPQPAPARPQGFQPQAPYHQALPAWWYGQAPRAWPGGAPAFTPAAGYSPACAPPAYALGQQKNPRRAAASKTLNRMCLVVLLQSVSVFVWELLFLLLSSVTGVNVLSDPMAFQWLSAAMVPLGTAFPFFVYLLIGGKSPGEYLRFEKTGFLTALLCVAAGLALCLLANFPAFAIQDFFSGFGYEPAPDTTAFSQSWPMLALELFSTAVVVPVMEEFAFRGVLFSALQKQGTAFAVVASALVFSLVHMDFSNVIFAFISGLVFGFLYARTRNLWITICIHALNNGIAVIGSYEDFLFGAMAEMMDILLMAVPIALGAVALLLLFLRRRSLFAASPQHRFGENQNFLTAGEGAAAIVCAPLFWVIVAMMAAYTTTLFF